MQRDGSRVERVLRDGREYGVVLAAQQQRGHHMHTGGGAVGEPQVVWVAGEAVAALNAGRHLRQQSRVVE